MRGQLSRFPGRHLATLPPRLPLAGRVGRRGRGAAGNTRAARTMSEWEVTCRVCLEGGDMVSLFDTDENNELLRDKYKYTTGIEVFEADPLPQLICLTCVDRLMFAYQFKQQCITSNETLKECLAEINKTAGSIVNNNSNNTAGTELITIKQENGVYLQYEIPVEREGGIRSVLTSAPPKSKRGRPRKYPNELGEIAASPYQRKSQQQHQNEVDEPSLSEILASGGITLKSEPDEIAHSPVGGAGADDADTDYEPGKDETTKNVQQVKKAKGGRQLKKAGTQLAAPQEDILLKETIMAFSEPIHMPTKTPKPKKKPQKKRYVYDKIHTCETCGTSFRSNASLQQHIRRHLGIKPFVCSVCGYSCVLNMELRRHMMRHTGVRPYKCRICDRCFGDFGSRQKHERLHLGQRPYQCTVCEKSFTYSYVLSNHMLTHTGEKKYGCDPCNKRFTKAHHLKYHNKVHHKELYAQQQLLLEQKRLKEQYRMAEYTALMSGQLTTLDEQMLEGHTVQLLQSADAEAEGSVGEGEIMEGQMQVVEDEQMQGEEGTVEFTTYAEIDSVQPDMPDIRIQTMSSDAGELIVGDLQHNFKAEMQHSEQSD